MTPLDPDNVKSYVSDNELLGPFQPITADEWDTARIAPDCIVKDYLYADVALLIAPGGTGKTTLILYEAICIATGLSLHGREVARPGPVIILTAEDGRDMLIARLNRIARAMNLNSTQINTVRESVLIQYVGNTPFRLTEVTQEVVCLSSRVNEVIRHARPLNPSLIVIDPAVSFGVGESRVNDAEQGLVMAARRIRDELNCCVRFVHHTGKVNAKDKDLSQYAGRGGSAFSDGARMVAILQPMDFNEWAKNTDTALPEGSNGLILALPKLSYVPPQPSIYIERHGYSFSNASAKQSESESDKRARDDKTVLEFLEGELKAGSAYSKSDLDTAGRLDMARKDIRASVSRLISDGKITDCRGKNNSRRLIPTETLHKEEADAYQAASGGQ